MARGPPAVFFFVSKQKPGSTYTDRRRAYASSDGAGNSGGASAGPLAGCTSRHHRFPHTHSERGSCLMTLAHKLVSEVASFSMSSGGVRVRATVYPPTHPPPALFLSALRWKSRKRFDHLQFQTPNSVLVTLAFSCYFPMSCTGTTTLRLYTTCRRYQ